MPRKDYVKSSKANGCPIGTSGSPAVASVVVLVVAVTVRVGVNL